MQPNKPITQWVQPRLMNILPYKLDTTTDLLTSRAGLLIIAQIMHQLKLAEHIDYHFTLPKSNRGFKPSVYIQTMILMQHNGLFHLDDVRHLKADTALIKVLGLKKIPHANSLGSWLRKMSADVNTLKACTEVNKALLKAALNNKKGITLDIDATEIISNKRDAKWTYKKNKGYMPMVGHVAETDQVVACNFRTGNTPPSAQNLEFIKQCAQALPKTSHIAALRIDAAGYQTKIIQYCNDNAIHYAIRAKTCLAIREQIAVLTQEQWQPLINKQGEEVVGQSTTRMPHWIGDEEKAFTLVIQRKAIKGQEELDLADEHTSDELYHEGYIYRAIASNQESKSDSEIIHWYNQRAQDSENRIKELKLDFGGDTLPCSDFKANELYFLISSLSYNLFALMRQLLPEELAHHRVTTIRWKLYAMAAKVVKTGRQLVVKLQKEQQSLLSKILIHIQAFDPPPIE